MAKVKNLTLTGEIKPKSKPVKRIAKRAQKAIVTQDNRFIYAKYAMNANEMKFFLWIVAQINSQKEQLFQTCEIPLSEIFQVWQWKENLINYSYCAKIIDNMARKVYIEDFKLLDETTMREIKIHHAMPLFKFIRYQEGQNFITYELNDTLLKYLVDLKRDFTKIKFNDIYKMKSYYSMRIYQMLISELNQNRNTFKMNLAVLQNILQVPKSLQIWDNFKQKVIQQAEKDINEKSNIVLLDIKAIKTGRKVTDLEFNFDYKNNKKRIERDEEKKKWFLEKLVKIVDSYMGKEVFFAEYGSFRVENYYQNSNNIIINMRRIIDSKMMTFSIKNFNNIKKLELAKDQAEELFYLDPAKVSEAIEFQKKSNRDLF